MSVVVTNNLGRDYLLPDRRVIPDGESVVLSDKELEWIPFEKRDASMLAITALSSPVTVTTEYLAKRIGEPGGGVTYFGFALPGTLDSEAEWQIQKMTESGGNTVVKFANGSPAFNQIWDDRASLPYS